MQLSSVLLSAILAYLTSATPEPVNIPPGCIIPGPKGMPGYNKCPNLFKQCDDPWIVNITAKGRLGLTQYTIQDYVGACRALPYKMSFDTLDFQPNYCVNKISLWPFKNCKYPQGYYGDETEIQYSIGPVYQDWRRATTKEDLNEGIWAVQVFDGLGY